MIEMLSTRITARGMLLCLALLALAAGCGEQGQGRQDAPRPGQSTDPTLAYPPRLRRLMRASSMSLTHDDMDYLVRLTRSPHNGVARTATQVLYYATGEDRVDDWVSWWRATKHLTPEELRAEVQANVAQRWYRRALKEQDAGKLMNALESARRAYLYHRIQKHHDLCERIGAEIRSAQAEQE